MSDWVNVASAEEIRPGEYRTIDVNDVLIAVFNVGGTLYAIEDICTHDGGILTGGEFSGCVVTCPRHGAQFDVRTGAVLAPPAYEPVASLPVRVVDGMVQVRDDRWD
ncbi:MAG TPA: non-heme iron oxygenase ferredoxin subunit [Gammaproteobacteria bacterium]|nr:non-heme iron oxygenase ferredoxin subunit [Gammaproteobacteria bacterium]